MEYAGEYDFGKTRGKIKGNAKAGEILREINGIISRAEIGKLSGRKAKNKV